MLPSADGLFFPGVALCFRAAEATFRTLRPVAALPTIILFPFTPKRIFPMSTQCPCYLISETRFRQLLPRINPNVPFRALEQSFRLVHDLDLPRHLGEQCVAELCDRQATDALTPDDELLLAELTPWLAWRIFHRFLQSRPSVQIDPQGLLHHHDESYRHLSTGEIADLLAQAGATAEQYAERLQAFLKANAETYPCWEPPACSPGGSLPLISGTAG